MRTFFLAISIFSLLRLFSNFTCKQNFEPTKKMFTQVDLLLREEPSLNGLRINMLPPGTEVRVKKTDKVLTQKNKTDYWYYAVDLDGYLWGGYLSDSRNNLRGGFEFKALFLKKDCDDSTSFKYGDEVSINLKDNVVDYSAFTRNSDSGYDKSSGTYTVGKDFILLSLDNNTTKLKYFSDVSGFLKEEDEWALTSKYSTFNKKQKFILYDDCKDYGNSGTKKTIGIFKEDF